MEEVWKDINGYEGIYEISSFGQVKSKARINYQRNRNGDIVGVKLPEVIKKVWTPKPPLYKTVFLWRYGKSKIFKIHRLVAEHFLHRPDGCNYVNHIDSNPQNNVFTNLEWCTSQHNSQHAFLFGRRKDKIGSGNPAAKLKEEDVYKIRELLKTCLSHRKIADMFGMEKTAIRSINNGKTWSHLKSNEATPILTAKKIYKQLVKG